MIHAPGAKRLLCLQNDDCKNVTKVFEGEAKVEVSLGARIFRYMKSAGESELKVS